MHGLSLAVVSGSCSSLWCRGCSLPWLLLMWSMRSRAQGLQQLWCMGLIAPQHVGSRQTKDQTNVPCIGSWILIHCAIREVPFLKNTFTKLYNNWGFPSGASGKEPACQRRRPGSDPWVRKIPWRRHGNPLQYSCLENPMEKRAWWATDQRVPKSLTEGLSTHETYI